MRWIGVVSFVLRDLVLIPGLGADARQFEPQRAVFPRVRVPRWIPPLDGETLRAYAARLGVMMGIGRDTVVGGSSFGGMVALEVARAFPCRGVVLIGSCRGPASVAPALRVIEKVARAVPTCVVGAMMPLGSRALPLLDPVRGENARLLGRMAREIDPAFLRWGGRAVFGWEGCEDPGVPVRHVHGSRDGIIPVSRVRPDVVVRGHGHFLNLTAADEVNAFLRAAV